MDIENPIWKTPNMLDDDQLASADYDSSPEAPNHDAGSETLTAVGTQAKGKDRTDSKRGSSASTPVRDGVAGFLHEDSNETSRASAAVTASATPAPFPRNSYGRPVTPKSASKANAKALLSPGKGTRDEPTLIDDDHHEAVDVSNMSLYDNMFGLQKRSEAPVKRRKIDTTADDDDDVRKKQKFEVKGGSGVVSEFLRNEKQKEMNDVNDGLGVAKAIDLTADEGQHDGHEDSIDDSQVVLGKIELDGGTSPYAMVTNVPYLKAGAMWKPGTKDPKWPPIPVRLVHETALLVRVVDSMRQRFGTLDGTTAKAIVPLLQNISGIQFKVTVLVRKRHGDEKEGDAVSQQAQLLIRVIAPKRHAKAIGKHFSHHRIWLRSYTVGVTEQLYNPHDPKTFTSNSTSSAASSAIPTAPYVSRTIEEIRSDVLNMFDSIIQTEQLREAAQPADVNTKLLSHQKQALYFLKEREEDRALPGKDGAEGFHLWKSKLAGNGKLVYYNVITGTERSVRPPRMRGGILADMMGLGKTLSMLSLIADSKDKAVEFSRCPPPVAENARLKANARTTLLICPLSVVSNWETQIKDHIALDGLTHSVYHGKDRTNDMQELKENDVVITSYHTVANELKRHQSPLFMINWFRIILDEAHIIRNPSAGISIAACELFAERRWAVTGTPVQNRLDDLGSLIKFLRIKPFDEKGAFAQYILAPFKTADPEILPKLRLLVDSITLRRLKDNINLPDRRDLIVRLNFTKEEKELYKVFVADSKSKVQLLARGERLGGKSYAHILKSIMRLRLICAHGEELLSDEDRKLLEGLTKDKAIDLTDDDGNEDEDEDSLKLSPKQAFEMLELLRTSGIDDCPRCGEKITNRTDSEEDEVKADTDTIGHMTGCYQVICPDCFAEHEAAISDQIAERIQEEMMRLENEGFEDAEVNINTYTCPYCRMENVKQGHYKILQSEVNAHEAEKARIRKDPKLARQMGFYRGPHTKTTALVEYLKRFESESHSMPKEDPIKSIVFSAWTSHLDLIQIALTANGVTYTRLDGSMSRKSRASAIYEFTNNPNIRVILITIGAGGLGLNLTAGSKVFVMEPQFNPAAEQQAVDRVHRLGQKREVEIFRFIMHDSFEENILAQQKKKIELADLAVNRNKKMDKAEAAKAKLESLKSLFR